MRITQIKMAKMKMLRMKIMIQWNMEIKMAWMKMARMKMMRHLARMKIMTIKNTEDKND